MRKHGSICYHCYHEFRALNVESIFSGSYSNCKCNPIAVHSVRFLSLALFLTGAGGYHSPSVCPSPIVMGQCPLVLNYNICLLAVSLWYSIVKRRLPSTLLPSSDAQFIHMFVWRDMNGLNSVCFSNLRCFIIQCTFMRSQVFHICRFGYYNNFSDLFLVNNIW